MDCLRSFNFGVDRISTISGADLKQWATGTAQHFWQISTPPGDTSTYNIQGFKNINVYGIDVIGSVQTQTNTAVDGVIVNDWFIDVLINGQQPLVGGNVTAAPNAYALDLSLPGNNSFELGRYSNSVKFASPYLSCKFIQLGGTLAQGIAYQTLGSVNIRWKMNFVVYYKFEDEDF